MIDKDLEIAELRGQIKSLQRVVETLERQLDKTTDQLQASQEARITEIKRVADRIGNTYIWTDPPQTDSADIEREALDFSLSRTRGPSPATKFSTPSPFGYNREEITEVESASKPPRYSD